MSFSDDCRFHTSFAAGNFHIVLHLQSYHFEVAASCRDLCWLLLLEHVLGGAVNCCYLHWCCHEGSRDSSLRSYWEIFKFLWGWCEFIESIEISSRRGWEPAKNFSVPVECSEPEVAQPADCSVLWILQHRLAVGTLNIWNHHHLHGHHLSVRAGHLIKIIVFAYSWWIH